MNIPILWFCSLKPVIKVLEASLLFRLWRTLCRSKWNGAAGISSHYTSLKYSLACGSATIVLRGDLKCSLVLRLNCSVRVLNLPSYMLNVFEWFDKYMGANRAIPQSSEGQSSWPSEKKVTELHFLQRLLETTLGTTTEEDNRRWGTSIYQVMPETTVQTLLNEHRDHNKMSFYQVHLSSMLQT